MERIHTCVVSGGQRALLQASCQLGTQLWCIGFFLSSKWPAANSFLTFNSFFFSYPASFSLLLPAPEERCYCLLLWAAFQMILRSAFLMHQNKQMTPAASLLRMGHPPRKACQATPGVQWQAWRQHPQCDSHLQAGVKLERDRGGEEHSQLMLISVRLQLRFVKR